LASRHSIDGTFDALKINTKEQLKVHLDSCPDKWIVGPAGSGKTCLLMEKVILLAQKIISDTLNQKILVVCYNRPLSLKISRTINHALKVLYNIQEQDQSEEPCSVVDVKTFDKVLRDINGSFRKEDGEYRVEMAFQKLQRDTSSAFKHAYDHVFVDEGQDLYHAQWRNLLKMMHKSSSGRAAVDRKPRFFWVFCDSNQHLHLSKESALHNFEAELINSSKLHRILRNTEKVFSQVNKYFEPLLETSVPVRVYHREVGLEIKWDPDDSLQSEKTTSGTNRVQSIVKNVEYLRRNEVLSRDICVLVKDEGTREKLIPTLEGVGIECQNAEELYTKDNNNRVVVESIRRFKGLESKVVILYDPPFLAEEEKTRELLYTAISRCLCYLVVISTKQGCESLKSEAGLCGIPGTFPNPSQVLASEPVEKDHNTLENTPVVFPAKRQFQDDDGSNYNQLYKRIKEIEGDSGRFMYLLGQSRSAVDASVRNREFKELLPSLWNNLQLLPEYRNVTQPALCKIGALLEYRVLHKSKFGNYVGNMEAKRQEIDNSTQRKEIDADVAGALKRD